MSFIEELKRRRVVRVALVYAAAAFAVLQAADILVPALHLPQWTVTFVVVLLALGFPIALALAWVLELTPDGIRVTPAAATTTPVAAAPALLGRRTLLAAGVFVLAGIAFGAGWVLRPDAQRGATGEAAASEAGASVAVLPFADLSDDRSQEYFGDGIAEELLNILRTSDVAVASRTSSFAFKGRNLSVREIADQLGVDHIIDGSVRKDGSRLRVSAQVIDVRSDRQLWSERFDRDAGDIFRIQEEIATAVASALRVRLSGESRLIAQGTVDVDAYDLYLRGRQAIGRRTPESLNQAIAFFRAAADRDPSFARAYAGLADTYNFQALNLYGPPSALFPLGKAAAERALALDPELAEAHASLAMIGYMYDLDWQVAERHFRRAIAIDSADADARYIFALFLTAMQRDDEAIEQARIGRRRDPLSPPIAMGLGIVLLNAQLQAGADSAFQAAVALDPEYVFPRAWRAFALAQLGRVAEARAEADRALAMAPNNVLIRTLRGMTLALLGEREAALHVADSLVLAGRTVPVSHAYVARIYALLGETERALEQLEAARANREGQYPQLLNLGLDSLFTDPRFIRLLDSLKLPQPRR